MIRTFAAMDIGTNSVRLAVVELQPGATWTTLASQKQVVRLGEGEFTGGGKKGRKKDDAAEKHALTADAIERGALVCARFAEVARGFGAEEIVALATAAAREAENGDDFVERVREMADLDVRVISGQEEARLIYLGVASGVDFAPDEKALFIDIGGGSTELIVGDVQNYHFLDSLRIGAIRATSEFIPDPAKSISPTVWADLQKHVRSILAPAAREIGKIGFQSLYGSSGTTINLAEMVAAANNAPIPTSFRNYSMSLSDLQALSKRLCGMTQEQRRRVPGINPERADIIIGGAAILQSVMETVGADSIRISDRGLREGIIVDRLRHAASADEEHDAWLGARRRSIAQLVRATNVDEVHAAHIVHLSLSLFDQWKSLGLHDYGRARELLEYAARLHDCGFFVSHTDHQLHSYYLIRHSELLGFNDREVEIIASLALYHRKGRPRKTKQAHFARLDSKTQRLIQVLSCALRLAEALDRSHLALIKNVRCERLSKPDRVRMFLETSTDAQLEMWAAEAQSAVFEKTFKIPLEVMLAANDSGENSV